MFPLLNLSWGQWLLFFLVWTQVVILLVTVYFHRTASHRALELAPAVHRVFRLLSWFMIAMVPREFAAVHRKHHATCDTPQDPHSPVYKGWKTVLFKGVALYRREAANPDTIEQYGRGLPVDPWESFYSRFKNTGIVLQLCMLIFLFGWKGALAWGLLMLWIPFWAAGVINGLGHHVGYRNFATEDHSTNLFPWGVWVGGEELHNNHHAYPSSAKFSHAWYEIDLGWGVIRIMQMLGLAKVRSPVLGAESHEPAVRAFVRLLRDRHVWQKRLHECFDQESGRALREIGVRSWRQVARWNDRVALGKTADGRMVALLAHPRLAALHRMEQDLSSLWSQRLSPAHAREAMETWLSRARALESPALHGWCQQISS